MNHRQAQEAPYSIPEFLQKLRDVGAERYHHKHPFHLLMHEGKLTRGQLQAWALNRYYYQSMIPVKDALILARSRDPEFRRAWRKRILDHDGGNGNPGGIEKWIKLAEATGIKREELSDLSKILPGVRYAVDAYLRLVSDHSFLVAVASSLTEMFSKDLITLRIQKLRQLYPHLISGLDYFEDRLTQAPEDAQYALSYVTRVATTRVDQESAIAALTEKCQILWAQLDAIQHAYVAPASPPPGAFTIEGRG